MPNTVKILRSTTAGNVPVSLVSGQIAINEKDGKIFWLDTTTGLVVSATIKDLDTVIAAKVSQTGANGAANLPAGTTAQRPTGAAGQLRYNSSTGKFEGFGSAWGNIGGGASISDTAPSNPGAGDLWWNSADGILYVYYSDGTSSQWVATDAGGEGQYVAYTDTGTVTTAMLANGSVTQAKMASGVAGNGPAFAAYPSAAQSFTSGTETKVQYNTEVFDTASCYDPATYRFTPNVAGYYSITAALGFNLSSATSGMKLYKNGAPGVGTPFQFGQILNNVNIIGVSATGLVYLNGSTDFVEVYARQDTGSTNSNYSLQGLTQFTGALVRAA